MSVTVLNKPPRNIWMPLGLVPRENGLLASGLAEPSACHVLELCPAPAAPIALLECDSSPRQLQLHWVLSPRPSTQKRGATVTPPAGAVQPQASLLSRFQILHLPSRATTTIPLGCSEPNKVAGSVPSRPGAVSSQRRFPTRGSPPLLSVTYQISYLRVRYVHHSL